ncbi:hypothetical protein, partial [Corallococcus sicarius]
MTRPRSSSVAALLGAALLLGPVAHAAPKKPAKTTQSAKKSKAASKSKSKSKVEVRRVAVLASGPHADAARAALEAELSRRPARYEVVPESAVRSAASRLGLDPTTPAGATAVASELGLSAVLVADTSTAGKKPQVRVTALGFFETVEITQHPGSTDNAIVLQVEVKEKATGTFQVGL